MKRILQFNSFFLFFLVSCGPGRNQNSTGFSTSASMAPTQNITSEERIIATRICYAYESKNASFKTQTYLGKPFNFALSSRDCAGKNDVYSILSNLLTSTENNNAMVFFTNSTRPFFKNVQTSKSGYLSQLCNKIQNNEAINNTTVTKDIVVQIEFATSNLDSYTLKYFSLKNGVRKITFAETFKVRTQFNLSESQILGMDEEYIKQEVCPGETKAFSQLVQTYTK